MSTTSGIFTGTSAYSSDFSNVVSRAVAIASLPIQLLTNDKTQLTSQSDSLSTLDTKFSLLQSAVQKVATALSGSSYKTSVSRDDVVDISVADGASEGVYSMKVTSIGAYETSMSTANWNVAKDSSGKPTTFTLVVGQQNYTITPADNSAKSVAAAINAAYGSKVQATTVNVAPGDTRISLRSMSLGDTNLDLVQVPSSAVTTSYQTQSSAGFAISRTAATWDASGAPAAYTLVLGGDQYEIAPVSNSAADVVTAINDAHGDRVRASVVDLGSGTSHDYRISLESTTAGPMNGSMTLDLKKAGGSSLQMQQYAVTSRSTAAWDSTADASGTRSTYTLSVGGTKYSFTPADNSATSVAGAINSLYGSLVTASVVDLHTGGNPDYRISLRSANGSSTEINLEKTTGTSFQAEQTQGALAAYEINGSGVTNTSATRDITISTGVTATLVGVTSGSAVDITVTRSTSALNTALSGFADAYNSAADELALHRGQTAGSLRGDSVVSQLSRVLSSIATYSSDGSINGLSSLGLELGTDGHFSYSAFTLMATDISSPAGVTAFLGSASDGGFLKTATDALKGVEDATTGILKAAKTDVQSQITKLTSTITEKQTAVDKLQQRLLSQMAAADALIASLEQKYSYLTSMFEAQRASQSQ